MSGENLLDQLPPNLPADLRAFLECTGDVATIANGPIEWVEIPANVRGLLGGAARPELQITPGTGPSSALLQVRAAIAPKVSRLRRCRAQQQSGKYRDDAMCCEPHNGAPFIFVA